MEKLNNKEAVALVLTICVNISILVASQIIIESCSSSSLINTCFISLIAIIFTCIVCALYKKFIGLSILDIADFLGGKVLKAFIGIIFFLYFLFSIVILLSRLVDCLQIVYYPTTNSAYTILLFIIAVGIICNFKNNAFSKANYIILPISLLTLILAFIGNTKNFDYQNIYPVLGNGINSTFLSGITNLFAFGGITYLYFLPSNLKQPNKFFKISVSSIFLSGFFLLISVATVALMFNDNLIPGQLFPIYTAVRYIEFGTFFQRLDSAFLLIRIISSVCFFSIFTNICLLIFKEITQISDSKPIIYPFLLLVLGLTMCLENYLELELFQNQIFKILFFIVSIAIGLIILILANLKKRTIK